MNVYQDTTESEERINELIQDVEEKYFIGRSKELTFFQEYIREDNPGQKIIHFYGEGGIGKTFLLHEFARVAKQKQIPFFLLDSQDFVQNVQGFIDHLYQTLACHQNEPLNYSPQISLQDCLSLIDRFQCRVIITIDTFEQMELERWFRNTFIRFLHPSVTIILAGRKPLIGEWLESPAWRKITRQIKLEPFTVEETSNLLELNGFNNNQEIRKIWEFTKGNPLLLTLATIINLSEEEHNRSFNNNIDILTTLTKRWLREVTNEGLTRMVEAAAMFHQFDQHCLSEVLNREIPNQEFYQLTSLSFVKRSRRGWSIHDLVRDAIRIELQQRNPNQYERINKKIIDFYYHRIAKRPTEEDIASFFYHLGDDVIQSVFFHDATFDNAMYLEPIGDHNFHAVEDFFAYLKNNPTMTKTHYFNRTTNHSFQFHSPLVHKQHEQELVGPEYIKKIGYNGSSLLKNIHDEVIGISIIVPVNEQTLPFLATQPVSSAYFGNLTKEEIDFYNVPVEKTAGYYIRYQEYKDPTNNSARSFLLYSLLPLIFSGGKISTSTPLRFYQDLLYKFGFQTVPGAEHRDFETDVPTPTFLLDLSGPKLLPYLKQFLHDITQQQKLDILAEKFSLTEREQDITKLILENKTIAEIASELFIAQITVKKSLSRIYHKANVRNRSHFLKKMMDIL
ncbi:hypothetical protein H8S33_12975 [Ornithinibacillus sp. BX22]|uniref:HTH luxR-type domain-containing protein n=1 Tax=Ornithinibacillus hominis TaxID=2763055 RepID=A0A923L726_9BACI|nr:LuxR family transcriptional regulator [Ornithinibacillus hominis]MBC5637722.1 hypothetical protein [Ornithinibacillus hominis]